MCVCVCVCVCVCERERDAEQGDMSNSIKNRCFNDFETCESIRIVRRQNHDSYE